MGNIFQSGTWLFRHPRAVHLLWPVLWQVSNSNTHELIGLATYAQVQLLLSDYVQHYGLRRRALPNGKLEPIDIQHSWNAPHWFSNYLMLAAPRHCDHHLHPAKPYPALTLPTPDQAPCLPRSLPVMASVALYPRLWRRVMDPLVAHWQNRAQMVTQQMAVQNALLRDPVPTTERGTGINQGNLPEIRHAKSRPSPFTDRSAGQPAERANPDGRRRV